MFSLPVLEDQLAHYVNGGSAEAFANPFDFAKVPVVTREQSLAEDRTKKLTTATPTLKAPSVGPKKADVSTAAVKFAHHLGDHAQWMHSAERRIVAALDTLAQRYTVIPIPSEATKRGRNN